MPRNPAPSPSPIAMLDRPAAGSAGSLAILERRLEDGYARIEEARSRGQDITAWEEFWIELLHQYEAAADDLPQAA